MVILAVESEFVEDVSDPKSFLELATFYLQLQQYSQPFSPVTSPLTIFFLILTSVKCLWL